MPAHWLDPDTPSILLAAGAPALTGPLTFPGDSEYAEVVYASVLGPSTTLIYRHFVRRLRGATSAISVDLAELAQSFGLRRATACSSVERLVAFHFARPEGRALHVRLWVTPPSPTVLSRLSPPVRRFHLEAVRRAERTGVTP